jgi:phenylacetate-CoA ligase
MINKIFQRKTRKNIQDLLAFMKKSQYWPIERMVEYQKNKLQKLLFYCHKNVPYYRELFQKIPLKEDELFEDDAISRIPVLTKSNVQEHFEHLISTAVVKEDLYLNSTGGSTGNPLNFYQDREYSDWRGAAAIRAWKDFVGCREDALEAIVWGAERDIGKGLNLKKVVYHWARENLLPLNTFDLDDDIIRKYFFYYNLMKPKILRGYASSLFYLANYMIEKKIDVFPPKAIISSAEMLWPEMRQVIESAFKAKVFDSYGCREVSQIATECEKHDGLHIVMENQYVELIDHQILVTNLNNYAMPLLRYQVGDIAEELIYEPCACGRSSWRLSGLKGRESEVIVLPDGKTIHGEYFTHLFYGRFSVKEFSLEYRKSRNELTIKCDDMAKDDENRIVKIIKSDFQIDDIKIRRDLKRDKMVSGKYKFINVIE